MVEENKAPKKAKKSPAKKAAPKKAAPKKDAKATGVRRTKIKDMTKEIMSLIKEEIKEKANKNIISQDEENKFINSITKKFKKAKEEAQILLQIAKLSIEVSGLKKGLPEKYKALGAKSYQLISEKKLEAPALNPQMEDIRNLNIKISDIEKKVQDLKKAAKAMME